MPAPKGNKFWQARSSHGRNPVFENPEDLLSACQEYFKWVEENPLYETKVFHNQGEIVSTEVPLMRAMTLSGLCIFLGISDQAWRNYRERKDFVGVTNEIEKIIRTQKFEGASANLLNSNIIARDLGLSDKQNVESTNVNTNINKEIDRNTDPKEAARIYQEAIKGE